MKQSEIASFYNSPDIYFSDQEIWELSRIDAEMQNPSSLFTGYNIAEQEMRCQRDMRVRGKRLWNYHFRIGDLADFGFWTGDLSDPEWQKLAHKHLCEGAA